MILTLIMRSLLGCGVRYVCLEKMQSDRLEGEFGVIGGMHGGDYQIAAEQVLSSLSLRRLTKVNRRKKQKLNS